jgi:hypothetical protein
MAVGLRLSGRKAWSCVGEGVAGLLWPVPRQRVQGTICGGSGSAERMRIVPRPRQVGHSEGMGLLGCVDAERAACSRAGRVVNFRQCHRRGGNVHVARAPGLIATSQPSQIALRTSDYFMSPDTV